ncbi:MAG: histidine phosphatase family protein [Pseudomonadota bacterium]|nr:histidine phosphatase family protein [Pseudomonadota bacterium]
MQQATRILAIRHGETAWNVDTRLQGHLDIALNDTGRRQAARLAQALAAREPLDALISSDLSRALDTARAVASATGAPLTTHTGLRERGFGALEGHTFHEISTRLPAEAERWRKREPDWAPPGGGESLRVFQARVADAMHTLASAHLGRHIALFTHGGVLDVLYRAATGLGLQDARTWHIGNAAINRLLWTPESGLTLIGWADTSHLEDETRDETAA